MSPVFILGSLVACCIVHVERFPVAGESLCARDFLLEPGGKGFNMLAGLHRLGVSVDGVLPVGDDLFGSLASGFLRHAGLPESLLCRLPGPSGGGVGFIDQTGETSLAVSSGANTRLGPRDILALQSRIREAAWTAAQFETSSDAVLTAFRIARTAGRRTLLNPSPFRPIDADILTLTSVLVVNETEADALALDMGVSVRNGGETGEGYAALAQRIHAAGPEQFIITLGEKGARAWLRDQPSLFQPAYAVVAIDRLGAGDAFNAGLLCALLAGQPWEAAMRQAAACGALTTLKQGVLDALPDRLALQQLQPL